MPPPQTLSRAIRPCYNLPILHFLYDTRTLGRFYSDLGSERRRSSATSDKPTPDDRPNTKYYHPSTPPKPERKFARPREPLRNRPPFDSANRTLKPDRPEEHVPFDSPSGTPRSEQLDPTTISGSERRAFEKLRKLGAAKQQISDSPTANSGTLDDVLEEAMFNIDAERHGPARAEALEDMRQREFYRISDLFKRARTDFDLWAVFENEVLQPIKTLHLDNPREDRAAAAAAAAATAAAAAAAAAEQQSVDANAREVLMHNFPLHLWNASKTLRSLFPQSALVLAVIPTIREMGPSIYALGASTKLYNQLIGFTLHNLTDLDRISEILQEMEDEVIEPDRVTLNMLNDVMSTWQKIRRGAYGEAARVAWETERARRSLATLAQQRADIEAVVQQRDASRLSRQSRTAAAAAAAALPEQPGVGDALVF